MIIIAQHFLIFSHIISIIEENNQSTEMSVFSVAWMYPLLPKIL